MKELQDRIITYVTKCNRLGNSLVSVEKILTVSSAKGFSEDEVLAALERIGTKLKSTVRAGTVYYQVPPPPKPSPFTKKPCYPDCPFTAYGELIPFYDPEFDGPTPHYSKETDIFYREKNEALKRTVESEKFQNTKFQRPVRYNKRQ